MNDQLVHARNMIFMNRRARGAELGYIVCAVRGSATQQAARMIDNAGASLLN